MLDLASEYLVKDQFASESCNYTYLVKFLRCSGIKFREKTPPGKVKLTRSARAYRLGKLCIHCGLGKDEIRICLAPRDMNKVIRREQFRLLTVEEIERLVFFII